MTNESPNHIGDRIDAIARELAPRVASNDEDIRELAREGHILYIKAVRDEAATICDLFDAGYDHQAKLREDLLTAEIVESKLHLLAAGHIPTESLISEIREAASEVVQKHGIAAEPFIPLDDRLPSRDDEDES